MPVPASTFDSPRLVGLTGSIASGKSTALFILGEIGAATISTDEIVADLLAANPVLAESLVARWGDQIAAENGVDRGRIAEIVFKDADELAWLEAEMHPLVRARIGEWHAGLPSDVAVAVVEVPLLFETEMEAMFDSTICIVSDEEARSKRLSQRRMVHSEGREQRQLTQEEKATKADHVVGNDGELDELMRKLAELWPSLISADLGGVRDGEGA